MKQEEEEYLGWLKSGISDLLDFDNNRKRGDYHRCLFFLQQSSEKLAKATMTKIGFSSSMGGVSGLFGLNIKAQKDYGHFWRRNFINQIRNIVENQNFASILSALEDQGLKNPQTIISKAKKMQDIKNPSEKDVSDILDFINNLIKAAKEDKFKQVIKTKLTEIEPVIDKLAKQFNKKVNVNDLLNLFEQFISWVFSLGGLMILSTLLSPFYEMRYPSEEDIAAFLPHFDEFREILESCAKTIE
jgi:HEPN domain-containing protein